MGDWICNKCREAMEEVHDIRLFYKEIELPPAEGLRCPSCKVEFLEAEIVTEELNPAEEMLEGK